MGARGSPSSLGPSLTGILSSSLLPPFHGAPDLALPVFPSPSRPPELGGGGSHSLFHTHTHTQRALALLPGALVPSPPFALSSAWRMLSPNRRILWSPHLPPSANTLFLGSLHCHGCSVLTGSAQGILCGAHQALEWGWLCAEPLMLSWARVPTVSPLRYPCKLWGSLNRHGCSS